MTDNKSMYMNEIRKVFRTFRPKIAAAPAKAGYNQILKCKIPSQYDLKRQRDTVIQDIVDEARIFGVDLQIGTEAEYKSPFDKPKDE